MLLILYIHSFEAWGLLLALLGLEKVSTERKDSNSLLVYIDLPLASTALSPLSLCVEKSD